MIQIELTTPAIRISDGNMYNTKTADLVAHGLYWDGSKQDRFGRSQILYKTKRGDFLIFYESMWEDEVDSVEVVSIDQAQALYLSLIFQAVDYYEAFGFEPEEL